MLAPAPSISDDALRRGQRHRVRDLAWASVTGVFSGGVILVACALALGTLLPGLPLALALLIAAHALISLLHAVAACAVNSWLHQLMALGGLGPFSWLGGALGSLFPFERLNERRKWWRPRRDGPASS